MLKGIRHSRLVSTWLILCILCTYSYAGRQDGLSDKERTLMTGQAALEDGFYSIAEQSFKKYIRYTRRGNERAEGILLWCQALIGEERYDEALELLEKRQKWAEEPETQAAFQFWTARIYYEQGRYDEAMEMAGVVEKEFPMTSSAIRAMRLRGRCYIMKGELAKAAVVFSQFTKNYNESDLMPDVLLDWAGVLLKTGDDAQALDVMNTLLQDYPQSDAAEVGRLWSGEALMRGGRLEDARSVVLPLTEQEAIKPERKAEAWFQIARMAEMGTNTTTALNAWAEGVSLTRDPNARMKGNLARGRLMIQHGQMEEGLPLMKEAIATLVAQGEAAQSQLELAKLLYDLQQYELAGQEYQHYLDMFSDRQGVADAQMGRGWSLWQQERFAESASAFEKAYASLDDEPLKMSALLKAADAYFANRQFKQAYEKYNQVASESEENDLQEQALYQAAESLVQLHEFDSAIELFNALKNKSGSSLSDQAMVRLANIDEERGNWNEALANYGQAIELCNGKDYCAKALQSRGLLYYRLGRFEEALRDFKKVVIDYPNSELADQAYYMRGWSLYLIGRNEEALELCQSFIEKFPESPWVPEVLFWLGEYHFNNGEFEQSEERFAEIAKIDPQGHLSDAALYWAGRAATARKEYLKAIDYFNQLAREYPNSPKLPETRFAQGDALSELGKFPEAILAFEEIIVKFPRSYLVDLAWGRKGDCQFTLGNDDPNRYQEALESYQTVKDSATASPELKLQAEYKMGRCEEKLGTMKRAKQHYMNVVYTYLNNREEGVSDGSLWFTRAAFNAADIEESEDNWREAVNIYKRVVDARVPASVEARERIRKIRFEQWLLF